MALIAAGLARLSLQVTPPSTLLNTRPPDKSRVPVPTYMVVGTCGSSARVRTNSVSLGNGRPVLCALQLAPPSVLLNTPPNDAPAYSVVGVRGSSTTAVIASLVRKLSVQVAPSSILLNTPPVPMCSPACTKAVELSEVAAYSVVGVTGSMVTALVNVSEMPELLSVQLAPAVVLLKMPPAVPAYTTDVILGCAPTDRTSAP